MKGERQEDASLHKVKTWSQLLHHRFTDAIETFSLSRACIKAHASLVKNTFFILNTKYCLFISVSNWIFYAV